MTITYTTVHTDLPVSVAKGIAKALIGSLNSTAIAYARGHIRFSPTENILAGDEEKIPTIDDFNESLASIDAEHAHDKFASNAGLVTQMASGDIAHRLMHLRSFWCSFLLEHQVLDMDVPLSIADTLNFQMSRKPDQNEGALEALATACDIDPAILKAANLKMVTSDTDDLRNNAGKILSYLSLMTGAEHDIDSDEADSIFDELPAHVRFKLLFSALRAYDNATQTALKRLLRGNLDGAGDIKMLEGNKLALKTALFTFQAKHRLELDAYLERGGVLPELEDRTIVSTELKAKPKAEPKVEPTPTPTKATGPTKGKAKRVKKDALAAPAA